MRQPEAVDEKMLKLGLLRVQPARLLEDKKKINCSICRDSKGKSMLRQPPARWGKLAATPLPLRPLVSAGQIIDPKRGDSLGSQMEGWFWGPSGDRGGGGGGQASGLDHSVQQLGTFSPEKGPGG